ncbi:DUF3024 domain-containing protein [Paenibacillus daejeonensis]|uniref:DUF3024 domain-containing protein n=1 Tax=Paenibacillus daejeonensis TaxID=135193 RepID=UPI000371E31B|nr:DUF3024 domain-containing protein [Paenibacillus daejeonensis]
MDLFTIRRLERILDGYIAHKVPGQVRASVRLIYRWDDEGLTLYEERPDDGTRAWTGTAIARFRQAEQRWLVQARNESGGWAPVPSILPHPDFECLLEQVELDREGLFWIS